MRPRVDRRAAITLADRRAAPLTDAVARADRAESAVAGERSLADALRERLDAVQAQLTARQKAIDAADGLWEPGSRRRLVEPRRTLGKFIQATTPTLAGG